MQKFYTFIIAVFLLTNSAWGQTQNDTIFNYKSETPIKVDGQATEACWEEAEWHAIDQVWIPYNTSMKSGDFEGRFKVSWDEQYLYVLVEVIDDMLSDDHADPLQNWWDDDCLEVFIDENRSMGDHERNCNAFAYHVSLTYDAVDLNSSGQGVNYKNNIEVEMDTISENTYLWEFAIKNYNASFNINNPEASRVFLSPEKNMGFTIAYCDNDETNARENFIGSVYVTEAHYNDMYKNADYFAPMVLKEKSGATLSVFNENKFDAEIYPVPAKDYISIQIPSSNQNLSSVSILTMSGRLIKKEIFQNNTFSINIGDLDAGMYMIKVTQGNRTTSKKIIKQ